MPRTPQCCSRRRQRAECPASSNRRYPAFIRVKEDRKICSGESTHLQRCERSRGSWASHAFLHHLRLVMFLRHDALEKLSTIWLERRFQRDDDLCISKREEVAKWKFLRWEKVVVSKTRLDAIWSGSHNTPSRQIM